MDLDLDKTINATFDVCQEMLSALRSNWYCNMLEENLMEARELNFREKEVVSAFLGSTFTGNVLHVRWDEDVSSFEFENQFIKKCMPQVLVLFSTPSNMDLSMRVKVFNRVWDQNAHLLTEDIHRAMSSYSDALKGPTDQKFTNVLRQGEWKASFLKIPFSAALNDVSGFFNELKQDYKTLIQSCEEAVQVDLPFDPTAKANQKISSKLR